MDESSKDWALEQFASAEFGDVRRQSRAARMLRRAAERPAGRLSEVFESQAELQAAYDFVESALAPDAIVAAFAEATLRAASDDTVFVVIDGTSLTLTDRAKTKDFGAVGARKFPTRGLKVIDALAVDSLGAPLGVLDVHAWTRAEKSQMQRRSRRAAGDNEMRHWVEVIERVGERARNASKRPWYIIDREGDCSAILRAVSSHDALFTIRAAQDRLLWSDGPHRARLRRSMQRKPVLATRVTKLCRSEGRRARNAVLDVRVATITIDLPNHRTSTRAPFQVQVVWARERRVPRGQTPIDWMLLTNAPVSNKSEAMRALDVYCFRWRIEDFHRTWKRGRCCVEETQLRRRDHVVRWATMLAAVAARVERLKHLARTQPDAPATIELTPLELQALRIRKKRIKKRTESDPEEMPTIATAVLWIGQCGSYHGKPTNMPGAICIGRGLERLMPFVEGLKAGLELAREK